MEESITPAWRFKTNREGAKREKNLFLQVFSYYVEIDRYVIETWIPGGGSGWGPAI